MPSKPLTSSANHSFSHILRHKFYNTHFGIYNSTPSRFRISQPSSSLPPITKMKKSGLLAVAAASAASAAGVSVSSSIHITSQHHHHQDGTAETGRQSSSPATSSSSSEKFAPRFDGLRFIETLVTAHR